MIRVFRYELKRLLWNKFFFGILLILSCYCLGILTGEVILGIANTAPFSAWSFGYYLSRLVPPVCMAELFFLTFFHSGKERQVQVLVQSTPVDPRTYTLIRCGAVMTGTVGLAVCVIALGIGFYQILFGCVTLSELLFPAVITIFPAILFCLGMGRLAEVWHPALLYVLIGVVVILSFAPLPWGLEFSLGSFYMEYPLTLGTLDPAFSVPVWVWGGRGFYIAGGILMFGWSLYRQRESF